MIETTGEFKKMVKALVKGAIKSKVFTNEEGAYSFKVTIGQYDKSEKSGHISINIGEGALGMCLCDDVSTRVYNKINYQFFEPISTQFEKLKNVNKVEFVI